MRRTVFTLLILALVLPPRAAAQEAPRYLPHPDTAYVQSYNPYRLYWVRGADTLGVPQAELTVDA